METTIVHRGYTGIMEKEKGDYYGISGPRFARTCQVS